MLDLGPRKVRAYYYTQQVWSFYNSVGMCDFVGTPLDALGLEQFIGYVNSVTGWNMSLYELMKVGERSNTLARLFNCREGFTPADDVLPARMHEGIGNGALKGERVDPDSSSWPGASTTRWRGGTGTPAGRRRRAWLSSRWTRRSSRPPDPGPGREVEGLAVNAAAPRFLFSGERAPVMPRPGGGEGPSSGSGFLPRSALG